MNKIIVFTWLQRPQEKNKKKGWIFNTPFEIYCDTPNEYIQRIGALNGAAVAYDTTTKVLYATKNINSWILINILAIYNNIYNQMLEIEKVA